AEAYAAADFVEAHERIVEHFTVCFPGVEIAGHVLDLGCGPGDISFRFAMRFPGASVTGVDGSAAMIELARKRQGRETATGDRVRFIEALIPDASLPAGPYAAIISNSLLHHLHRPAVLWETIATYASAGTRIYVADLRRPPTTAVARRMVESYAGGEPDVLRRDFYHSLCAAFEPREVEVQLEAAGLTELAVAVISDRHLVVHGVKH
ncbi:MAG: class I SAM-dependent methyltransferase, partial [Gammaproteobacteria bacterium]